MITYKDMTFCSSTDCQTLTCFRHPCTIPEEDVELLVGYCNFKETCPDYENKLDIPEQE